MVNAQLENLIGYWTDRGNDIPLFNLPKIVRWRGNLLRWNNYEWHSPSHVSIKSEFFQRVKETCDECIKFSACGTCGNGCLTYKFFILQSDQFLYR